MSDDRESQMWTEWVRERAVGALPPEKLLPDRQPSYVCSWIYVFGVATIAALIVIVTSGVILGLKGPRLVARLQCGAVQAEETGRSLRKP